MFVYVFLVRRCTDLELAEYQTLALEYVYETETCADLNRDIQVLAPLREA